jgi:AcrR family transcriptional regulator
VTSVSPGGGREVDSATEADPTAKTRILAATAEVLGRKGHHKLNLSDVATQAKVSRTTLYKWFPSKEDLLEAFAVFELRNVNDGFASAIRGLEGPEKLDAAVKYIVEFQKTYSLSQMVDIEPAYVNAAMSWVLPIIRGWLRPLLPPGEAGDLAAASVARTAVCHYLVRSDDTDQFMDQLRHAVGLREDP